MTAQAPAHDSLRFIVLQPGARMSYAVPALLARAGMLERFYTDICADVGLLRHFGPLWPPRLRPKPVARLLGRRLPREVPRGSVRHAPVHTLAGALRKHLPGAGWKLRPNLEPTLRLMEMVRIDQCAAANALYTTIINADLDLVRDSRDRGLKIVHEAFMNPLIGLIIKQEREMCPGLEGITLEDDILAGIARDAEVSSRRPDPGAVRCCRQVGDAARR